MIESPTKVIILAPDAVQDVDHFALPHYIKINITRRRKVTRANVPLTHIGTLIEQGLRESGLDGQSELARRCGVDRSYIFRLKTGAIKHPREDILQRVAIALNQDPDYYRLAILADAGDLPSWCKVLEQHKGVRLSSDEEDLINQYVQALLRARRG